MRFKNKIHHAKQDIQQQQKKNDSLGSQKLQNETNTTAKSYILFDNPIISKNSIFFSFLFSSYNLSNIHYHNIFSLFFALNAK